jgi:hypothetical protein
MNVDAGRGNRLIVMLRLENVLPQPVRAGGDYPQDLGDVRISISGRKMSRAISE